MLPTSTTRWEADKTRTNQVKTMETKNLGNILLVTGHTYEQISVANKMIVEGLKKRIPTIKEDNLVELYPDFRIDIKAEQEKLLWADTVLIQVPLFWFSMPSIIMRWIEEVFQHGWAYGSKGKALQGKNIIVGITAGSKTEVYESGQAGLTVEDFDKRFKTIFSFCNMNYKGIVFNGGFLNMGDGTAAATFAPMVEKHVDGLMQKLG